MLSNPLIEQIIIAVIVVVASFFFGKVLKFLLNTLFKRLFAYTDTTLDDLLLDVIRGRVTTLSVMCGIFLGLREIKQALSYSQTTTLQIIDNINIVLFVVLILVLTKLIIRVIETVLTWYLEDVSQKTQSSITPTIAPLGTKIINIILFFIAGMIVLDHFGINIGSFLVSLGVGSLAVALAAQETVANMIAGFVILVDQPFRVGDRVKLASGDEGDVTQIGLRSTRIINFDHNLVIIPNGELVKNRIVNISLPDRAVRALVDVGISFEADIAKAKSILLRIAKEHPGILSDPPPAAFTLSMGEFSVILRLSARTPELTTKHLIEDDLRMAIIAAFQHEGIEIPYPQRVIQTIVAHGSKTS